MVSEHRKYRYRIDANDNLIEVDLLWLAFASENGAIELTEANVLGKSLWEFISGRCVHNLYSTIHARVRETGKSAVIPFRCDSPTLRRYMRLTISRGYQGTLGYESKIERVVPQRRLGALDCDLDRSHATLEICSCCKRAKLEDIGWLDLEDVCFRLGIFEEPHPPQLQHTICPVCADSIQHGADNHVA